MNINMRAKIITLPIVAALLSILIVIGILEVGKKNLFKAIHEEQNESGERQITQIAHDMYALCKTAHDVNAQRASQTMKIFRSELSERDGISLSKETVNWQAKSASGSAKEFALPKMMVGNVWLGQITSFTSQAPLLDHVQNVTGIAFTLYQKANQAGDMLSVASSMANPEGGRSVGVLILADNGQSQAQGVVLEVLDGQRVERLVDHDGDYVIKIFEPLLDNQNETVGMLEMIMPAEAPTSVARAMMRTKVGKTGYVWAIGAKGQFRGIYVVSKNGARNGENIWEAKDHKGELFVQKMVAQALAQPGGKIAYARYPWGDTTTSKVRMKVSAFTYFAPWDWVVGAGVYEDEFYAADNRIGDSFHQIVMWVLLAGGLILLLIVLVASYLGNRLTQPIMRLTELAGEVATGDIGKAVAHLKVSFPEAGADQAANGPIPQDQAPGNGAPDDDGNDAGGSTGSGDETSRLAASFIKMTDSLSSLISQVQRSGIQVQSSATEITASARQLEATVAEQVSSTNEVSATSKEISLRSQDLAETMVDVTRVATGTAELAAEAHQVLPEMEESMRHLMENTTAMSEKLAGISEKASNIGSIVTTITKVADQTNLLSLNAAIEAEKAGEFGLGFSVVAREIRRLADQTAVATLDIEKMVGDMEGAVSTQVMEMDKFVQQVNQGVDKVEQVSRKINTIIDSVQTLFPRFESVSQATGEQSASADEISVAMSDLSQSATQTREALSEFNRAAGQLSSAVHDLQGEISSFKVRS